MPPVYWRPGLSSAATSKKDFSSQSLAEYERLLKESFVLKDLETFKKAPHFLDNPRLMGLYPQFACDTLENLMFIGEQPKKRLVGTAIAKYVVKLNLTKVLKDALQGFQEM